MSEESKPTDGILGVKIDGLKELTDTRFKNLETTLFRIEKDNADRFNSIENMGFVRQADYEIKHKELEKKIEDSFSALSKEVSTDRQRTDIKISAMQKTIWVATGFCAALAFFLPIIIHIYWK